MFMGRILSQFLRIRLSLSRLLLVWFLGAVVVSGILLAGLLNYQAQTQIMLKARILSDTTWAIRDYTQTQINPLLLGEMHDRFHPQSVPSYAAQEVFRDLRTQPAYETFFYKEAVLNPTNLRDKANGFETELIKKIQQRNLPELTGFQNQDGNQLFYLAQPIVITDPSCLKCHSTPDVAPQSMLNYYGTQRGFGWKLNETVGIRITYIPTQKILQAFHQSFFRILTIVILFLAVGMAGIYWFLSDRSRKQILMRDT